MLTSALDGVVQIASRPGHLTAKQSTYGTRGVTQSRCGGFGEQKSVFDHGG